MRREIERRPGALDDLAAIWEYSCTNWGEAQADRYLDGLEDAIEGLAVAPGHRFAKQVAQTPYWKLRCQRHLIVFEVLEQTIDIVRVLHAAMDIEQHLG